MQPDPSTARDLSELVPAAGILEALKGQLGLKLIPTRQGACLVSRRSGHFLFDGQPVAEGGDDS